MTESAVKPPLGPIKQYPIPWNWAFQVIEPIKQFDTILVLKFPTKDARDYFYKELTKDSTEANP